MKKIKILNSIITEKEKHIILWGIGERKEKYTRDFEYAFSFSDRGNYIIELGDKCNQITSSKNNSFIIVCSDPSDYCEIKTKLITDGLKEYIDFARADDFFKMLNHYTNWSYYLRETSLDYWMITLAYGYMARKQILIKQGNDLSTLTNIDDFLRLKSVYFHRKYQILFYGIKEGLHAFLHGRLIWNINKLNVNSLLFFGGFNSALGFRMRHKDFGGGVTCYEDSIYGMIVDALFSLTYYDKKQTDCICTMPFDTFMANPNGTAITCSCPSEYLLVPLGNCFFHTPDSLWKSNLARIIRLSFINRTYSFCSREPNGCPYMKKTVHYDYELSRLEIKEKNYPSALLHLALENACNLKCPSCRMNYFTHESVEHDNGVNYLIDNLMSEKWIEKTSKIAIGGAGEAFLGKGYKRLYSECKGKRISIATNGQLFTPEVWESLKGNYAYIEISVSIDGITEQTYKKLRGGDFNRLMRNMVFLSQLRREDEVNCIRANFIVQQDNYLEMEDFVKWAKSMMFDEVYLSDIDNWGTFSDVEFRTISMFDDNHIMKPELAEILKKPIFKESIVKMKWNGD